MRFFLILIIVVISGCSSSIPLPPEPTGEMTSVNPSVVRLSDLEL